MTGTTAKKYTALSAVALTIFAAATFISACGPTYPKERLPEAVKEVCRAEYDMEVDVTVEGETMGIYYSMPGLLDANMGIKQEAWDTISSLILIASRVVLSTDADISFYCVITQDIKLPELQVVIVKYVEDVKMSMYQNISRSESFKRTLFNVNLTPQARKERSVESIFGNIGLEDETRERILDEFFRSTPTKLSDIGYWKGKFYLKDIGMEEFLASQMANRIKIDFRSEEELSDRFDYKSSDGAYNTGIDSRYFLLNFKIDDIAVPKPGEMGLREEKLRHILGIARDVVYGYKFKDFDFILMNDQSENVKLRVDQKDVYNYDPKSVEVRDIVQAPAGYFYSP
jgi:hypothetical protein